MKFDAQKFVNVLTKMGFTFGETIDVKVDQVPESEVVIASAGIHVFNVRGDVWPRFLADIEQENAESIYGLMGSVGSGVEYVPAIYAADDHIQLPSALEDLKDIPQEIKDEIAQRFNGLMGLVSGRITKIAQLINLCIPRIEQDGSIIKDYDGILTLNTEKDINFNLHLCFDRVKPIYEVPTAIEIFRTPMTQKDKEELLGEVLPQLEKQLTDINEMIQKFFQSRLVSFSGYAVAYAAGLVNKVLLEPLMQITPTIVSFGGIDNWRLTGELTPNAEVCHKLLDQEVEHVFRTLKSIPLQEGVELYSIDLLHLGIYGRDSQNKVVTNVLSKETDELNLRWSDGFSELMKIRLGRNDNRHLFYMQ